MGTPEDDEDMSVGAHSWLVPVRSFRKPSSGSPNSDGGDGAGSDSTGGVVPGDEIPGALYVPAFPVGSPGSGCRLMVELWETDAKIYALAYSGRAQLVRQLGRYQPWLLVTTDRLRPLLVEGRVDALILDPAPGAFASRWTRERMSELLEVNHGLAAGRP